MELTCLPPELILEISDYLPLDGILALKLTDPSFNNVLPLAPRARNSTLSDCARLAIRTYLASPLPEPSHMRCILCKAVYPIETFLPSSSPAYSMFAQSAGQSRTGVLPGRICAWHVGSLARIVRTGPRGRNEWSSHMDRMCMHCGAIQRLEKCDCHCDSCSFRTLRTYTRFLNNDAECRSFAFWQPATDSEAMDQLKSPSKELWVKETCCGNLSCLPLMENELREIDKND